MKSELPANQNPAPGGAGAALLTRDERGRLTSSLAYGKSVGGSGSGPDCCRDSGGRLVRVTQGFGSPDNTTTAR
jgi:hypothetical protein